MVELHILHIAKTHPDSPLDPKRFVFAHNNLMSALIIMWWRDPHSKRPAHAPIGATSVVWASDLVEIHGTLFASCCVSDNLLSLDINKRTFRKKESSRWRNEF